MAQRKRLGIMGGAVTGRGHTQLARVEFNSGFDPGAANVVFSEWPQFDLIDWEACVRHAMAFDWFDAVVAGGDARAQFYAAISRKARAFNQARERLADRNRTDAELGPEMALDELLPWRIRPVEDRPTEALSDACRARLARERLQLMETLL